MVPVCDATWCGPPRWRPSFNKKPNGKSWRHRQAEPRHVTRAAARGVSSSDRRLVETLPARLIERVPFQSSSRKHHASEQRGAHALGTSGLAQRTKTARCQPCVFSARGLPVGRSNHGVPPALFKGIPAGCGFASLMSSGSKLPSARRSSACAVSG